MSNPFATEFPPNLQQAQAKMAPPFESLSGFVKGCSPNAATRSVATTAMVIALAQTGGPRMIGHPPGFLLVNAGSSAMDPIDMIVLGLTGNTDAWPTGKPEDRLRNCRSMDSVLQALIAGGTSLSAIDRWRRGGCRDEFERCRRELFGGNRAGLYSQRFVEKLGWFTDCTDHVVLRLNFAEDRVLFTDDVKESAARLHHPVGISDDGECGRKLLSVAGAIKAERFDAGLVAGIVSRSLPVLFLPHTSTSGLRDVKTLGLESVAVMVEQHGQDPQSVPVTAPSALPPSDWLYKCLPRLRQRLVFFPESYEFFVQRTIRELNPWCSRLAGMTARKGVTETQMKKLHEALFANCFHAVWLGVEALAWHGYGFCAGDPATTLKVLAAVRENGTISRRDLQRKLQCLQAADLGKLLTRLAQEGLLTLDARQITAVPFSEFFDGITGRTGIQPPDLMSEEAPAEAVKIKPAKKKPARGK